VSPEDLGLVAGRVEGGPSTDDVLWAAEGGEPWGGEMVEDDVEVGKLVGGQGGTVALHGGHVGKA
jgi:hypothetical protein